MKQQFFEFFVKFIVTVLSTSNNRGLCIIRGIALPIMIALYKKVDFLFSKKVYFSLPRSVDNNFIDFSQLSR